MLLIGNSIKYILWSVIVCEGGESAKNVYTGLDECIYLYIWSMLYGALGLIISVGVYVSPLPGVDLPYSLPLSVR